MPVGENEAIQMHFLILYRTEKNIINPDIVIC